MASFQFPDPNVTQTVTNPVTGTVYQWQDSSGKWAATTVNTDAGFVELAGDTMTGPLAIEPPGPINTDTPLLSIDNSLGGGSEKIINVNTTSCFSCTAVK